MVDRGGGALTMPAELGDPGLEVGARGGEPAWWRTWKIIRDHLRRVTQQRPRQPRRRRHPRVPLAPHLRR
ncbi:MAG: hypothetical protein U0802_15275 [Candidatus Binatia bacterium]